MFEGTVDASLVGVDDDIFQIGQASLFHGGSDGLVDQGEIRAVADDEGDNLSIMKIHERREIELHVFDDKLGHVRHPFTIR